MGQNGFEILARLMEDEVLKPEFWQGSWLPCVSACISLVGGYFCDRVQSLKLSETKMHHGLSLKLSRSGDI